MNQPQHFVDVRVSHLLRTLQEKYEWELYLYQVQDSLVIHKDGEWLCEMTLPDPMWFKLTPNADVEFIELIRTKIDAHLTTKLLEAKTS